MERAAPTADPPNRSERIWHVVASIPKGNVATYGQVAELAGLPRGARQVGQVLSALPKDSRLPWHRVVNARGELSLEGEAARRQRTLLREEGHRFSNGRLDLRRHRWAAGVAHTETPK